MKKSSVETINSETLIQFHKTLEEGWNHNWTPHSLAKLILSHRSRSIGHMLEECKLVTFAYTHMRKKNEKQVGGKMVDDYDRLLKELNLKYHNASKMMSIWRSKRIHRLYENMENEKVELPVALSTLYAIATADCEHETKIIEAVREEGKSCRRSSIEAIRNGRKQVTGSLTVTLGTLAEERNLSVEKQRNEVYRQSNQHNERRRDVFINPPIRVFCTIYVKEDFNRNDEPGIRQLLEQVSGRKGVEVCYRRNTQNPLDRVAGMTRSVGTYAELPEQIKSELEEAGQVEDAFKLLDKGR